MFEVSIKPEIKQRALSILETQNFGMRGQADGSPEQQQVGLIGEMTVLDLYGINKSYNRDQWDNGYDMICNGHYTDIKTMGRTVNMKDHYVHNFNSLQKDYECNIYIFCSYNKSRDVLQICGWIDKALLLKKASFHKQGSTRYRDDGQPIERKNADLYEIMNSDLKNINNLTDLYYVGKPKSP